MQTFLSRFFAFVLMALMGVLAFDSAALAQSRPQRPEPSTKGEGKKNTRPVPKTEEELKKEEEERKRLEEEKNATDEPGIVTVDTNVVSVDAVVYNKKTGAVITGLKKDNFGIFENGVKQNISSFSTPEAPITVTVVIEYSKWTETFGRANSGGFEPGAYETVRPVAQFLGQFIRPPGDYASVIAFDIRPTPITDFTNDPNRLRQTVDLLFRNSPAFRENALYASLKLALVGGKADAVVLERSKERTAEYAGMVDLNVKRKAIILVASGLNTAPGMNFGELRKIVQEAGVPIYIISTGHMFCKLYCDYLDPSRVMPGTPDRLDFEMARTQMTTLAKESGGAHFELTFPAESPNYLNTINALLRSQYNIGYDIDQPHEPGKKYKLEVRADVDGDGVYDDKTFVVQHKPFIVIPKGNDPKLKK